MVKGLALFREHFRAYADRYILIGGAACEAAMDAVGEAFRATKDLDIVLCVEALDAEFVAAFWAFVRAGGYENRHQSTGARQCYRFQRPANETYPAMLELFARRPDLLRPLTADAHLTPLPMDDVSSLSAILMDDDYYRFVQTGKRDAEGLSYLGAEHLLPLKARAWLDLSTRKELGHPVDSRAIRKHRDDVFRLYRIVDPARVDFVPEPVREDLREFFRRIPGEPFRLDHLDLRDTTLDEILTDLARLYRLG